ncbi:aminoglycoside phosphotransferase family protein [Cryptosporangium minutisporangium]|uniref:Aminoglycoside phosphotransferase family protein n=1 Tax=Cryptosporangium minutisporangium TaxID=113569 RepID=A0ABP6SV25_9ACTN
MWGDAGRQWLDALPALVDAVARQWGLTIGAPYSGLSYHWVAQVTDAAGAPAVLKLGPPGFGHLQDEAAALRAFDGHGAARLLDADDQRGALLLEQVRPGSLLRDEVIAGRDAEATAALVAVATRLHRAAVEPRRDRVSAPEPVRDRVHTPEPASGGTATPEPSPGAEPAPGSGDSGLPDVRQQREAFPRYLQTFGDDGPLPRALVERADRLFTELCDSATRRVVLHGDLHHDNVLRAERAPWLAIDPHGVVGDPGYDAGALLYNPDPDRRDEALLALVPARVEQLADGLGEPIERITAWGFAVAMLSEVWDTEGRIPGASPAQGGPGPTGRAFDVARILLPRLR